MGGAQALTVVATIALLLGCKDGASEHEELSTGWRGGGQSGSEFAPLWSCFCDSIPVLAQVVAHSGEDVRLRIVRSLTDSTLAARYGRDTLVSIDLGDAPACLPPPEGIHTGSEVAVFIFDGTCPAASDAGGARSGVPQSACELEDERAVAAVAPIVDDRLTLSGEPPELVTLDELRRLLLTCGDTP